MRLNMIDLITIRSGAHRLLVSIPFNDVRSQVHVMTCIMYQVSVVSSFSSTQF